MMILNFDFDFLLKRDVDIVEAARYRCVPPSDERGDEMRDEDGDDGDFTDNDDELDTVDEKMNTEGMGDAQDNSPAVDDDLYAQIVRPVITRS